jgi:uncharacterized protein YecE (DUF72 family)
MEYLVGTAGWSYADWKGTVYPQPQPRGFDELAYLADYFDCVEINSSFYRPPAAKSAESWVRRVEHRPDFLFTAKLWQGFTHERDGAWTEDDVRAFLDGIRPLEEAKKFGALLLQFPWFFRNDPSSRDRVRRLAERFGGERDLVIEIRDRSWTTAEGLSFLTSLGLNVCSVDMPLAQTTVRPVAFATGSLAYLRLHGRNAEAWFSKDAGRDSKYDYLYQPGELDEWLQKLGQARGKPETAYVIANNHYRGQAPCNALQIKARLTGGPVAVPESLLATFPELQNVVES